MTKFPKKTLWWLGTCFWYLIAILYMQTPPKTGVDISADHWNVSTGLGTQVYPHDTYTSFLVYERRKQSTTKSYFLYVTWIMIFCKQYFIESNNTQKIYPNYYLGFWSNKLKLTFSLRQQMLANLLPKHSPNML